MLNDNKRPDGTTLLPWARGKPMAWDVTVPDTYAESHIGNTATTSGAAANRAAQKKTDKYANLSSTCLLSLCSGDSWCMAWDGHWADIRDGQTHHHSHRRLEKNNILIPASFHSSPTGECGLLLEHHDHWVRRRCNHITLLTSIFPPTGFVLVGFKIIIIIIII